MSKADRNDSSRARLREYEQLVARETAAQKEGSDAFMRIAPGPELGSQVVEFRDVAAGYNGGTLFEGLSLSVPRGAVVGLTGPNGTGKPPCSN